MWVVLSLCSALLLGVYDVFKKKSLNGNAVIPVLSISIFFSCLLFLPLIIISSLPNGEAILGKLYVPNVSLEVHIAIFIKSVIVLGSWICAYFGMKHIPITIFSPIRATQPLWTVVLAFFIFGERLSGMQLFAVLLILISFYMFTLVGKSEGVEWKANHWLWLVILATLFGSASGLYDNHLLKSFPKMSVQVFSTVYQSLLMFAVMLLLWWPNRKNTTPFQWRWTILGISIFLIFADYVYFTALSDPDSLISVVSTIRRSGAVVPFVYGALFLREKNVLKKSILLCGVLLGVFLLYWFK